MTGKGSLALLFQGCEILEKQNFFGYCAYWKVLEFPFFGKSYNSVMILVKYFHHECKFSQGNMFAICLAMLFCAKNHLSIKIEWSWKKIIWYYWKAIEKSLSFMSSFLYQACFCHTCSHTGTWCYMSNSLYEACFCDTGTWCWTMMMGMTSLATSWRRSVSLPWTSSTLITSRGSCFRIPSHKPRTPYYRSYRSVFKKFK